MIRVLLLLSLCHFSVDLFTGIWPIYKKLAGLDIFYAGLIAGTGAAIGNGMQLWFGFLADRGHRRKLIVLGLCLASSACWYAYIESYWVLLALVFGTFIGSSTFHPSATGLVGGLSRHRNSFIVSIFISGGTLGYAFSQMSFYHIYKQFEGHTAIMSVLPMLVLLFFILTPLSDTSKSKGVKWSEAFIEIKKRKWEVSCLYFVEVLTAGIHIGFVFLLPEIMELKHYDTWLVNGGGHLIFVLGSGLLIIPAGYFADKTSEKTIMFVSLLGTLIFYNSFIFSEKLPEWALIPLIFTLGGCMGVCNPVGVALGNRLFPNQGSFISGLLMGFAWALGGLTTVLVGYLSVILSPNGPVKALMCIGGYAVINLILVSFLPGKDKLSRI